MTRPQEWTATPCIDHDGECGFYEIWYTDDEGRQICVAEEIPRPDAERIVASVNALSGLVPDEECGECKRRGFRVETVGGGGMEDSDFQNVQVPCEACSGSGRVSLVAGAVAAGRFPRNVVLDDEHGFRGEWVAVPAEDFDALRTALDKLTGAGR